MSRNLLFADDDCETFLAPLARRLKRSGFNVIPSLTFREALQTLETKQGAPNTKISSILLDIVLPFDRDGRGVLMSDLGIRLAEHASSLGVGTVAFLTVVRRDEIADKFSELQRTFTDVRFGYFDKTELLSREELNSLIEFLGPNGTGG